MWGRPSVKIPLRTVQPVNAPFVTPPLALRGLAILCLASVPGFLVFAVAQKLTVGFSGGATAWDLVVTSVSFFVLPVAVAYTISVNRPISRLLIAGYAGLMSYHAIAWASEQGWARDEGWLIGATVLSACFMFLFWLFRSNKNRVYFALISGRALPGDIDNAGDELLVASKLEVGLDRLSEALAPYAEFVLVLVVLAAVVLGWVSMG
ncbi:MAG: hypothetical protein R3288_04055 [Woeseiaceae bacterium]|nr:hypothetical protein [Woeseiaceae bacterium]